MFISVFLLPFTKKVMPKLPQNCARYEKLSRSSKIQNSSSFCLASTASEDQGWTFLDTFFDQTKEVER